MASTTTNGVVLEVPYGILQNFRRSRRFVIGLIGRDGKTRIETSEFKRANAGLFVYAGDTVYFELVQICNETGAPVFDIAKVNPSTGVVTVQTVQTMPAYWMKRVKLVISAINGTTGTLTYTATYE